MQAFHLPQIAALDRSALEIMVRETDGYWLMRWLSEEPRLSSVRVVCGTTVLLFAPRARSYGWNAGSAGLGGIGRGS